MRGYVKIIELVRKEYENETDWILRVLGCKKSLDGLFGENLKVVLSGNKAKLFVRKEVMK